MKMSGSHRIRATRETVWAALNDAEVLKASIPGCDELERTGETGFTATVTAKVGPVKATFQGAVELSDLDPPNGYRISGEGKGGPAGFAKGGATIRLEEIDDETELHYDVDVTVGGKLAQLGSRLIDGTAKKLAGQFFDTFGEQAHAYAGPGGISAQEMERINLSVAVGLGHANMTLEQAQQMQAEAEQQAAEQAAAEPVAAEPAAAPSGDAPPAPAEQSAASAASAQKGLPGVVWVAGLIVVVLVVLALVLA